MHILFAIHITYFNKSVAVCSRRRVRVNTIQGTHTRISDDKLKADSFDINIYIWRAIFSPAFSGEIATMRTKIARFDQIVTKEIIDKLLIVK